MTTLHFRELSPAFGVEVSGFDKRALDDADTRRELQEQFDQRGLLLFRELDFTHADQVRLSQILIRKEHEVVANSKGEPIEDTFYISNKRPNSAAPFGRLQFHSDTMWAAQGFEALSLYGVEVEPPTAPTTFVSGVHAWKTLPEALKARVDGLEVLQTAGEVRRGDLTDVLVSDVERPPTTVTPIGRRHPRTGETILYVCEQMTKEVVGLPHDESEALLGELFEHLYDPATQLDHEWRERDLVIWDNLALQHSRRNVTTEGPARTLRKVAIPMPKLSAEELPVFSAAK